AGDAWRIQAGVAARQGEVQTYAQLRMLLRQRDGFVEGRFVDHQAGRGQNALAMGADHRRVNAARPSEIVGVDDQAAHLFKSKTESPRCKTIYDLRFTIYERVVNFAVRLGHPFLADSVQISNPICGS